MIRSSAGSLRALAASIACPANPSQGFLRRPARPGERRSDTCKLGSSPGKDQAVAGACGLAGPSDSRLGGARSTACPGREQPRPPRPPGACFCRDRSGQHARMLLPFAADVQTTLVTIRGRARVFLRWSATDRVALCHGAANPHAIRVAARSHRSVQRLRSVAARRTLTSSSSRHPALAAQRAMPAAHRTLVAPQRNELGGKSIGISSSVSPMMSISISFVNVTASSKGSMSVTSPK